jgi:hypothetical protein
VVFKPIHYFMQRRARQSNHKEQAQTTQNFGRYLHCIDFGCATGVEFLPLRHVRAKMLVGKHRTVEPGFGEKLPICLPIEADDGVIFRASIDISPLL